MTLLVCISPEERPGPVVSCAALLARTSGSRLVLVAVVPEPAFPDRFEYREYAAYLTVEAEQALERARERIPGDIEAELLVHQARSVVTGLEEVARDRDARLILLGSFGKGLLGRVSFGSVSDHLLHSAEVPVAVVPHAAHVAATGGVGRITVAYQGPRGDDLVVRVAEYAARHRVGLRLATFAVHPRIGLGAARRHGEGAGHDAQWREAAAELTAPVLERLHALPQGPPAVTSVAARGESWEEALDELDWQPDDVLVVGSGHAAAVGRVFLGVRASKIVHSSPVPVVVLPA